MNKTDNTLINLSTTRFIDVEDSRSIVNMETRVADNIREASVRFRASLVEKIMKPSFRMIEVAHSIGWTAEGNMEIIQKELDYITGVENATRPTNEDIQSAIDKKNRDLINGIGRSIRRILAQLGFPLLAGAGFIAMFGVMVIAVPFHLFEALVGMVDFIPRVIQAIINTMQGSGGNRANASRTDRQLTAQALRQTTQARQKIKDPEAKRKIMQEERKAVEKIKKETQKQKAQPATEAHTSNGMVSMESCKGKKKKK